MPATLGRRTTAAACHDALVDADELRPGSSRDNVSVGRETPKHLTFETTNVHATNVERREMVMGWGKTDLCADV